jgi:hypothetical protein
VGRLSLGKFVMDGNREPRLENLVKSRFLEAPAVNDGIKAGNPWTLCFCVVELLRD